MDVENSDELNGFMRDFEEYYPVENVYRNKKKGKSVAKFSIFDVLGLRKKEKIHTKFLAYLLNPYSGHGQGSLFIEKFIECVIAEHKGFSGTISPKDDVRVGAEYYYNYNDGSEKKSGYIDIIVIKNGAPYWAIENKIDAQESYNGQEDKWQCERYFDFISKCCNQQDAPVPVLYLTPEGRKSYSGEKALSISFDKTIRSFLLRSLPLIECKIIEHAVWQYRTTVLELTKQRRGEMEILNGFALNFLTENNNYENAKKISEMVGKFGDSMTLSFFNALQDRLKRIVAGSMAVNMEPFRLTRNNEKGVFLSDSYNSRFYIVFGCPADKSIIDRNDDPGVPWLGVFVKDPEDRNLFLTIQDAVTPWFKNRGIEILEGDTDYPAYSAAPEWPVQGSKDFALLLGEAGDRYAGTLAACMIELFDLASKAAEQCRQ